MDLPEHRDVVRGLALSVRMDAILDSHKWDAVLPEIESLEFLESTHQFNEVITALIGRYHPSPGLFHFTDKNHLLIHLGLDGRFINPGLGSCYQGEELMRIVKQLVGKQSRASKPPLVLSQSLLRYCYGLSLDLYRPDGWWS